MILGRVEGTVVATIIDPAYQARRLLLVGRVSPEGEPLPGYLVAVDVVGAGVGDLVLMVDEGNSARQLLERDPAPVRAVVVAVVDAVEMAAGR